MNTYLAVLIILLTSFQCKKEVVQPENKILSSQVMMETKPLFTGKMNNGALSCRIIVGSTPAPLELTKIELTFLKEGSAEIIKQLTVRQGTSSATNPEKTLGNALVASGVAVLETKSQVTQGINNFYFDFELKPNCSLNTGFQVSAVKLYFSNHETQTLKPVALFTFRPAITVRSQGQDNCDTYRIPGLITTGNGTLIAVYDNRYNNSKDLQENIDIGMSRSTDGGQTWEPMKVIMDMGMYGGLSQQLNGCGDPSVLYDEKTGTIWVAALWMSGLTEKDMLWWASKPGMLPNETGQFILVNSTDDGKTWSKPINITSQIKNPGWQLLLQGPGRGISMKNGTIVFPAQFKADLGTKAIDGGQFTCHSTIVYSSDQGKTWQIGTGAKSNTTEAAVVELADGSLMLNMRDDRNRSDKGETNGRAVAVTSDMGKTWKIHPSSNSALPEPNCMASLISAQVNMDGADKPILFFSNPNHKTDRVNMTIKASVDQGLTWPEKYQVLLNSNSGYGYSCLTMVDKQTIGILYEGTKDLYFQKIPVSDILVK